MNFVQKLGLHHVVQTQRNQRKYEIIELFYMYVECILS